MEITLAIDIGSSNISIYQKNVGLVLKEPCLIVAKQTSQGYVIRAVGKDAKNLQGKTDASTTIFSPIAEGVIKSEEYAEKLLKELIKKVVPNKSIFTKLKILVCVPTGIDTTEKEKYINLCYSVGAKEVIAIPKILTACYGLGINISANNAHFVVDMGGGSVDVGVINLNSIIEGATLGLGGRGMDTAIMEVLKDKYNIEIGAKTAQKLKEEIGSLFENDNASMEVSGINCTTKTPMTITCTAIDVQYAILPFINEIIKVLDVTINQLEPEISADVVRNGIYISGGLSKIAGIEKYLRNNLNVAVYSVDNGEDACIYGAGRLLGDTKLLEKVLYEL